jgi:hypothetical protein
MEAAFWLGRNLHLGLANLINYSNKLHPFLVLLEKVKSREGYYTPCLSQGKATTLLA